MSKTETLPAELSVEEIEQIEKNCIELSKKYQVATVHPYVAIGKDNERIIGYLKAPTYMQKLYAMDKLSTLGAFTAMEEMRSALTLTEESDPRTYSTSSDCDKYRFGMASTTGEFLEIQVNAFKKK